MRLLQGIHNFDLITFDWCLRRKHRELAVKVSRYVSFTADGPLYLLIGLAFIVAQNWPFAKLIALGFAVERCFYFVFKTMFKRNRPPAAIPGYQSEIKPSDQFSFPSGHTSAAFFMTSILVFAFPVLGWLLYPWACCVGAARVTLGVHFPTDIIAGGLMGHTIGLVLINHLMLV